MAEMKLWIVLTVDRSEEFSIVRAETKEEAENIAKRDFFDHIMLPQPVKAYFLSNGGDSAIVEWWKENAES